MDESLISIKRLTKDLKEASRTLSTREARFLVDMYYQMQDQRIRANNQVRSMTESGEPHDVLKWFLAQSEALESSVHRALDAFSDASPVGRWARNQYGIGPVIAAGLLAHIDIEIAITAGKIWRYAGLDSTIKWHGSASIRQPVGSYSLALQGFECQTHKDIENRANLCGRS